MKDILSRRNFIKGLGAATLALPFYDIIMNQKALAKCSNGRAARVIFIYHPDGCAPDKWHPQGSGTNFTLNESTSPLKPFKNQIVFFHNLQYRGGNGNSHALQSRAALTGNSNMNNKSLDRELAETVGANDPFKHIHLGVVSSVQPNDQGEPSVTYSDPGVPKNAEDNPLTAWNNIFGSLQLEEAGPKKSIIDIHLAELKELSSQLGETEKRKLNRHLESLAEVEKRIGKTFGSCTVKQIEEIGDYKKFSNVPQVIDMQIDIMVQAMACGLSRVGTLQISNHTSNMEMKWPGTVVENIRETRSHQASHNSTDDQALQKKWINQKVARLLQALKEQDDPACSGNMLDNSLVYVFTEVATGAQHGDKNMPVYLAGGGGGSINTGQVYETNFAPHNHLLVSIANAMGHNINSFGGHSAGPLPNLLTF